MNLLSVGGLVLDLSGVMLLGIDLVRVQRQLKSGAEDRLSALADVTENVGGIDGFLQTVSSDFREYTFDEGRAVPLDYTFDPGSARRTLNDLKDSINTVADQIAVLAEMTVATVEADRETANSSLTVSYAGLALILLGFCLQIPAYL